MAYYTSRVDQDGNEIERRVSARSQAASRLVSSTARTSLSSADSSQINNLKYVNTAAYIERGAECSDYSDISSITSDETRSVESSGDPAISSTIDEMTGQDEARSDIVPPLDLRSEDNFPTRRDYTFSYRKHCEAAKISLKLDHAYETWLSAKRKTLSDEAARKKKEKVDQKKAEEERKRLAKEKYEKWLEKKARQEDKMKTQLQKISPPTACEQVAKKPSKPEISDAEARRKLEEWDGKKRREEEKRRLQKKREEERRAMEEEQRKKLATEAWDKWKVDAKKKPKPVPLNRGIFTLRGTISDHWVNPNEWKTD